MIVEQPLTKLHERRRAWGAGRLSLVGAGIVMAGVMSYVAYLALNWPFKKQTVIDALQQASLRTVTIGHFRETFFPVGCVAEGVRFERHEHKDKEPIIYFRNLTVQGSYAELLTAQYRLRLVKVTQMHVTVPPARVHGKPDPIMPLNRTNSVRALQIDKIIADGAVLDFAHEDGTPPYRITVEKLVADNVKNNSAISYKTIIQNTLPPGKIRSSGVFGPWDPKTPANTPLRGSYSYEDANLAAFQDLSGTMQAHGTFGGKLGEIRTAGIVDVNRFHVTGSSHERELKASFQARIDGTKGNTFLDGARASFDRSVVSVKGTITGQNGRKGKTVALDLLCESGRIEDILNLFIAAKRPPIVGALQMQTHLTVPPGRASFLNRMRMWGDFGITGGIFTDGSTQSDLNRLSKSTGKEASASIDNGTISLSDLKGHGDIRDAVATLTHLSFQIPGATADIRGTYNLIDYDVDLHGRLYTQGKPSAATTGFKRWVLRVVTPFLKKKGSTRIVPIKITGNYHKTNVGLDLPPKN
ncbi:MAG TPA: AsmA-like C-terminal region-containing protein [Bryobacteraceae bacterium]|nr:AsmA-like C-terminal region-containing protein [Bryobacteraceae bacterium]